MPRPADKQTLLQAADAQFAKLWNMIEAMSEQEQHATFTFEDRDKNVRDVLVHLYEWHQMVNRWHDEGCRQGGKPAVPGEGYTWKTLPALNMEIWKRYQHVPLEEAKPMLKESHAMIIQLIQTHTNEELFGKAIYPWTKSSTLGAYFVGCTSSHYDWAMKKLAKHRKAYRVQAQ